MAIDSNVFEEGSNDGGASAVTATLSTADIARVGIITETAPASDTASSGLNGRLQRIAQRLTTIYAYFTSGVIGGGITYTDKTITSATGSSQVLAVSNASRKSLFIKNGASNTGLRYATAGTAAIGGAATMTLLPYEPFFLSGADCPTLEVTVISTAGAYISAWEGA